MWIFLGSSGCSLVQKSCHEITLPEAKASFAQMLRNSPRSMSLTGYPSASGCPARHLMMPCQSLPDTRHRSRHIRWPAAQSKLRSSAHGCSVAERLCPLLAQSPPVPYPLEQSLTAGAVWFQSDGLILKSRLQKWGCPYADWTLYFTWVRRHCIRLPWEMSRVNKKTERLNFSRSVSCGW